MYQYLLRYYRFWSCSFGDITFFACQFVVGIELTQFGISVLLGPLEVLIYWPKFWGVLL